MHGCTRAVTRDRDVHPWRDVPPYVPYLVVSRSDEPMVECHRVIALPSQRVQAPAGVVVVHLSHLRLCVFEQAPRGGGRRRGCLAQRRRGTWNASIFVLCMACSQPRTYPLKWNQRFEFLLWYFFGLIRVLTFLKLYLFPHACGIFCANVTGRSEAKACELT